MAISRTDDGMEVEWTSSSVPVEQLDAATRLQLDVALC